MRKSAYMKDILRTIGKSLPRFLAIAVMAALGIGIFSGFAVGCLNAYASADAFYDQQKMYDLRIASTLGLTREDVQAVRDMEGIEAAEGVFTVDSSLTAEDGTVYDVTLRTLGAEGMNQPLLREGTLPRRAGEIAVTEDFCKASGLKLGDRVLISRVPDEEDPEETDAGEDEPKDTDSGDSNSGEPNSEAEDEDAEEDDQPADLTAETFTITGIVVSILDITTDQLIGVSMAGNSSDYEMFVSETSVSGNIYSYIYAFVENADGLNSFEGRYEDRVDAVVKQIRKTLADDREEVRYLSIVTRARDKIDDGWRELTEKEADARTELAHAQKELDDGRKELEEKSADAEKELADAQKKIDDGRTELDRQSRDGAKQLADARRKIDVGLAEIREGEKVLADSEADLIRGEEKLAAAESVIAAGEEELAAGEQQIAEGYEEILRREQQIAAGYEDLAAGKEKLAQQKEAAYSRLEEAEAQITAGMSQAESGLEQVNTELAQVEEQIARAEQAAAAGIRVEEAEADLARLRPAGEQLQQRRAELTGTIVELKSSLVLVQGQRAEADRAFAEAEEKLAASEKELAEGAAQLQAGREELDTKSLEIAAAKAELEAGRAQLEGGREKAAAGREEWAAGAEKLAEGRRELEAGQKELDKNREEFLRQTADARNRLNSGQRELDENRVTFHREIADAETELTDGQRELDENREEFEVEIADARKELEDAEKEIDDIGEAKWYTFSRTDNDCFSGLKTNVNFIKTITSAFPILFFLVAVLISLSTMARMVEEDRGLIGTYKSLGFSNRQIVMKYVWYAVLACGVGSVGGMIIGARALPALIAFVLDNLYIIPTMDYYFFPAYELGGIALCVLGIVGATMFTCLGMVRKRPATLMRPKSPKAGKRIFLEYFPGIWSRTKFLNKVTCRNLFRYKKRAFMTITGIMGCTMMIVLGFGIRDTVRGLLPSQYGEITLYDDILVTGDITGEEQRELEQIWEQEGASLLPLQIISMTLRTENAGEEISVFVMPEGSQLENYIALTEYGTGEERVFRDDTVVLTEGTARKLGIVGGESITLQDDDQQLGSFRVDFVAENHIGNFVYLSEIMYRQSFGEYAPDSYLICLPGSEEEKAVWERRWKSDSRISAVSSTLEARDTFRQTTRLVTVVVYVLIAMSAALALTVLFTLSNINISERARELATIKVLGFSRQEVNAYVNKETMLLTAIGILMGLPAGYIITYLIMDNVNMMGITMKVQVTPAAYLIAAGFTFGFALLVNRLTNRDLDRINMVEALKSIE